MMYADATAEMSRKKVAYRDRLLGMHCKKAQG